MPNEWVAKSLDDAKEQLRGWNNEYKRSGQLSRVILDSVKFLRNDVLDGKSVKVYTFKVKVLSRHPKHHL